MIKINCMMLMETWSILLGGKWTSSSSSAGSPTSSPSSSQSSTTPFIRVHRWRPWTLNLLSMSSVVDGTSGTVHAVDMVNFNLKYLQIYSKNFRFEKLKLWEWCNENENYKSVIVKKNIISLHQLIYQSIWFVIDHVWSPNISTSITEVKNSQLYIKCWIFYQLFSLTKIWWPWQTVLISQLKVFVTVQTHPTPSSSFLFKKKLT